jgi:4-alpha-glucanotransferase
MNKMFAEFDAIRVDHPHGLVCPWVYRVDEQDPTEAVQRGARLFSSPDLPDHPGLARYAIPAREQLNPDPACRRYAEDWVVGLTPQQVDRYALLFDELVRAAHRNGRQTTDLICEVLSTMPYPLGRVLERHGLGRFRVTQKADLNNPEDVYRSEKAEPADWIMIGNHDTKPIWRLVDDWRQTGELRARAEYLAKRLIVEAAKRPSFVETLIADPGLLAQAQLADLLASRAENVMIFFTDLFGLTETYNVPGTVGDENWSLRLPPTYQSDYRDRVRQNRALNLPLALGFALRAAAPAAARTRTELLRTLDSHVGTASRENLRFLEEPR